MDKSNGYEAIAAKFISRARSNIGAAAVREWARTLPSGSAILDSGCGSGVPVSEALVQEGHEIWGADASPTMIAAFRSRFPEAQAECAAVEESSLFSRTFDGVVAWGLMFLLPPETQKTLIGHVAGAMNSGGRFLFTAPKEACTWLDSMTGQESISLGREAYEQLLSEEGLVLVGEQQDEGENYYYFASKV